jgi:hypothetical protein
MQSLRAAGLLLFRLFVVPVSILAQLNHLYWRDGVLPYDTTFRADMYQFFLCCQVVACTVLEPQALQPVSMLFRIVLHVRLTTVTVYVPHYVALFCQGHSCMQNLILPWFFW